MSVLVVCMVVSDDDAAGASASACQREWFLGKLILDHVSQGFRSPGRSAVDALSLDGSDGGFLALLGHRLRQRRRCFG